MPLIFSRQLHVTGIIIDQPNVTLLRAPSGEWNFSTLGAKGAAAPASSSSSSGSAAGVSVQKIEITNGKLIVGEAGSKAKMHEYDQMNLTASNLSYTSQFPFQFSATTPGNGTIKLSGKAGPLNQTDAAQTPLEANLEIHNLDLTLTGFMDPSAGIAGVLDFAGTLSSDGQQVTSKGKITANKLKLVPGGSPAGQPVQVDYDTNYALKPQTGSLKQGDVHIGKAVAHLTGTFNNSGATPSVAMKLNGADMPASDLESVLPAVGVILPSGASLKTGTMNAELAIEGPVNKLVTTGPVKLSNGTLAGFDLGAEDGRIVVFRGNSERIGHGDRNIQFHGACRSRGHSCGQFGLSSPIHWKHDRKRNGRGRSVAEFCNAGKSKFVEQSDGEDRGLCRWRPEGRRDSLQNSGHHVEAGVHSRSGRNGREPGERRCR